jgi:CubicO group peptidase (beta-lactamase class C family)
MGLKVKTRRMALKHEQAMTEPCDVVGLVDHHLRALLDEKGVGGLAAGVVAQGRYYSFGFGRVSERSSDTPSSITVFEIGSISKVFTGLLLADMAERGEVSLDDPVSRYLPGEAKIPEGNSRPITLFDLATHSSGLPRLPSNLAPKDDGDPYADYTEELLYAYLKGYEPKRKPGSVTEYSNLGMGLLGFLLARRAGKTYEELVIERIAGPLGMNETRITLTDSMRSRLAQGHDERGRPVPLWHLPTLAGAGGLRSTISDMLTFLRANLGPAETPLPEAIEVSHEPRRSMGLLSRSKIALAWIVRADGIIWHNGQTGGYHSFTGFWPGRGVGVVVLANRATEAVDAPATRLLEELGRSSRVDSVEPQG